MKKHLSAMKIGTKFARSGAVNHLRIVIAGATLLMVAGAPAQNLFVSLPNSINEITPGGVQSTFASGLPVFPNGLAFDSAGNLFVADQNSILKFAPNGAESTFASGLGSPTFLAFNSSGDLFVSSWVNDVIYEFTPGGVQSTFASGLSGQGLAFDKAGDLFVANGIHGGQLANSVIEITPTGVQSTFATGLNNPLGLAFNSAGDLFVADAGSGNIYEFTPDGVRSTFATGLNVPSALAFNSAGDLFVADLGSQNIYEFTPGGVRTTFASGPATPYGLAFQGLTLPVTGPSAFNFNALVKAVSISTNNAGDLVYRRFGNHDLIRNCTSQMGITNLMGLHLVYDLNADALEVVSGCGTNQTLVCTPLAFSGGVFLGNANATRSERQAWVYWDGQTTPSGTLTAMELYVYGASNQLTRFSLSGQLQFTVPGSGTNKPTIYQGSVEAGSRFSVPVVPPRGSPRSFERGSREVRSPRD